MNFDSDLVKKVIMLFAKANRRLRKSPKRIVKIVLVINSVEKLLVSNITRPKPKTVKNIITEIRQPPIPNTILVTSSTIDRIIYIGITTIFRGRSKIFNIVFKK